MTIEVGRAYHGARRERRMVLAADTATVTVMGPTLKRETMSAEAFAGWVVQVEDSARRAKNLRPDENAA